VGISDYKLLCCTKVSGPKKEWSPFSVIHGRCPRWCLKRKEEKRKVREKNFIEIQLINNGNFQ
jgi:hypothetical protein